jgi:hypothetical protein
MGQLDSQQLVHAPPPRPRLGGVAQAHHRAPLPRRRLSGGGANPRAEGEHAGLGVVKRRRLQHSRARGRGVALQVEFERQILKPAFHFIGYRLWV